MASASSLAQLHSQTSSSRAGTDRSASLETVEIDPQLAAALGFAQGDVVEIGLLHDLPVAKSIATEPLTADDWEILVSTCSSVGAVSFTMFTLGTEGIARWLCRGQPVNSGASRLHRPGDRRMGTWEDSDTFSGR